MRATVAATPDGRLRLHPTSIKAAGFVSKRVLDFFGLELENLVKMKDVTGVTVDGDDLLLEPQRLLPPPRIRGRLTRAWIENGVVMQQFGGAIPRTAIAPAGKRTNYMYYRHGTLRFGKLTMRDADLLLVDTDPKDPFDFSPAQYNDQLVAGYSKNTPARGLIVYMPDLADLPRRSTRAQAPDAGCRPLKHRALRKHGLDEHPAERKHNEQIRQQVAEGAVGPPRFRARVDEFAVGQEALLRHLVKSGDDELHDEDEQEDRGRLEEQPEVDEPAVTGPEPRNAGRAHDTRDRAHREVDASRTCISSSAVSRPSRLTIRSVKRKTPANAAGPGRARRRLETHLDVALHLAARPPHVNGQPGDRGRGDQRQRTFDPFLVGRVEQADRRRRR